MQYKSLSEFLLSWIPKFAEKNKAACKAFWLLETTGSKDAADLKSHLDLEIKMMLSDAKTYEQLLLWEDQNGAKDPLEKRQLEMLIRLFKENQIPTQLLRKITEKETEIALEYAAFRPTLNGKKMSENDLRDILKNEKDVAIRKKAWEASKVIGSKLAPKIIELVKYRNEAAQKLGYENYFLLQLDLQEVQEKPLFNLLKELSSKSKSSYDKLVEQIEAKLAEKFGVEASQIGPWAYSDPFGQEDPLEASQLDALVQDVDMAKAAKDFFEEMGFCNVGEILENSDLYEREGKNQHAFCMNVDHDKDIRTLNNLRPSIRWMETLLHELGHGVYEQGYAESLPWLLRQPPHMIPTEAMALLCGRQAYMNEFLSKQGVSSDAIATAEESLKRRELIFSRWVLVMTYFERDLYQNPDQDLNSLWWKYVEAFQKIKAKNREGSFDWASKYHIGLAPVYYFSYLLGELYASSLQKALKKEQNTLLSSETKNFLEKKVFAKGAALSWEQLIESSLGKKLTAEDWLEEFGSEVEALS